MRDMRAFLVAGIVLISAGWFFVHRATGEIYQYTDKTGKIYFVDDPSKIPLEYRGQQKVHKEKYDDLPQEERLRKKEEERREREALRRQEEEEQEELRQQQEEEEALRRQEEEETRAKKKKTEEEARHTTPLMMRGNTILVPVTFGYGSQELEATLVLDTGAEIVTVYELAARRLGIKPSDGEPAPMRMAGGQVVQGRVVKMKYIRVGGVEEEDLLVVVLPHRGSSDGADGLLGMNFLRKVGYRIDAAQGVIRWRP